MKNIHLITGALLAFSLSGCIDDSYDLDNFSDDMFLPIEQVVPVGRSEVSMSDVLSELDLTGLNNADDGLIYFQYDTVSKFYIDPFRFSTKDGNARLDLGEVFPVNIALPDVMIDAPIPMDVAIPLTFSDDCASGVIDSAVFQSIRLDLKINTNVDGFLDAMQLEATLPENVKAETFSPLLWDDDRASGRLVMTNVHADFSQTEEFVLGLKFVPTGKFPLSKITSDSYIEVVYSFEDIHYKKLYGLFQSKSVQYDTAVVDIPFLKKPEIDFSMILTDPSFELSARTNSGLPISVSLESLVAYGKDGKPEVAQFLNGSPKYELQMLPSKKEGEEVVAMNERFDRVNGGIDRLINSTPEQLQLITSFLVGGNSPSGNKTAFILDSTYVGLGISAVVPLWMEAGSYVAFNDTIELDLFEDIDSYEKEDFALENATLYLEVENGLPLNAQVDFDFLTADSVLTPAGWSVEYAVIENELFKQNVKMEPAEMNAISHGASKPTKNLVKITLDESMVSDLKRVKNLVLHYRLQVPVASASTKVHSQDLIKVKAYLHAKGYYSSNGKK